MPERSGRRLPGLGSLEYFLLLAGLVVTIGLSVASAIWSFPVAWLMPVIFLALYMILRVLVPLRGAEPGVRELRGQVVAPGCRLDALQARLAATPVEYHAGDDEFCGRLAERVTRGAQRRIDVAYFREAPPGAVAPEEPGKYFQAILGWAGDDPSRVVRRIIGVHTGAMREWACQHWLETRGITNYQARVVEYPGRPGMLSMALVDDRFVHLAFPGGADQPVSGMSIDDPRACRHFTLHYDQDWASAVPLAEWAARNSGHRRGTRAGQPGTPARPPARSSPARLLPGPPAMEAAPLPPDGQSGHDSRAGTWTAIVAADREYYDARAGDVPPQEIIPFPEGSPERCFPLSGSEALIGRRSATRGIHPEIDLTSPIGGPLADTGVNREHAKLVAGPDGSWSVIDLRSDNGTLVNGREIPSGTLIKLRDGDRINLGMWTAITIRRGQL